MLVRGNLLVAQEDDTVIGERLSQLAELPVVDTGGDIDAADFGSQSRTQRMYLDGGVTGAHWRGCYAAHNTNSIGREPRPNQR